MRAATTHINVGVNEQLKAWRECGRGQQRRGSRLEKRQEKRRPETSEINCDDKHQQNYWRPENPVFERAGGVYVMLHAQMLTQLLLRLSVWAGAANQEVTRGTVCRSVKDSTSEVTAVLNAKSRPMRDNDMLSKAQRIMLSCPRCGRQFPDNTHVCPHDFMPLRADDTLVDAPVDRLIGLVFDGKYRLDERLGGGGMRTVYRAMHLLIDRPVAIKVLSQRFVGDETAQQRFRAYCKACPLCNRKRS